MLAVVLAVVLILFLPDTTVHYGKHYGEVRSITVNEGQLRSNYGHSRVLAS